MRVRRSFANNKIVSNPQGRSMVQVDRPLTLSRLISISSSTSRTIYPIGCSVVAAVVYPKNVVVVTAVRCILLSVHTSDNIILLLYKHSPGPIEVVSQGHLPCVPCVVVYVRALTPRRRPGPRPHSLTHMRVCVHVCVLACMCGVYMGGVCVCDEMCRHIRLSFAPAVDAARDVRSPNV